jgi:hypothetical protein
MLLTLQRTFKPLKYMKNINDFIKEELTNASAHDSGYFSRRILSHYVDSHYVNNLNTYLTSYDILYTSEMLSISDEISNKIKENKTIGIQDSYTIYDIIEILKKINLFDWKYNLVFI